MSNYYKKQSRFSRIKAALKPNTPRKKFLSFILVFALIGGGYMAYRSFAYIPNLSGSDGEFTALTPTRIVDTRNGTGTTKAPLKAKEIRTIQISGKGGVPASDVTGVVLNITATGSTADSHLTLWPNGTNQPNTSNVNFKKGQTVANHVTVKLSSDGKVRLYNSAGSTHAIFDVAGYYSAVDGDGGTRYTAVQPARILDTRTGKGAPQQKLGAKQQIAVQVGGQGGVAASGVSAVVLNVTATNATADSHFTVWPSGTSKPNVSNINFVAGQTVPNQVTVKVGKDGKVLLYNASGSADAIFDVAGYYADQPTGYDLTQAGRFLPVEPKRIWDTRTSAPSGYMKGVGACPCPLKAKEVREFYMHNRNPLPSGNIRAVVMNVTVTAPTVDSHLTLWPKGSAKPATSSLNYKAGQTVSNQVTVMVGSDEDGTINVANSAGNAHVIMDIAGYFIESEESSSIGSFIQPRNGEFRQNGTKYEYDLKFDTDPKTAPDRTSIDMQAGGFYVRLSTDGGKVFYDVYCHNQSVDQCENLSGYGDWGTSGETFTMRVDYNFEKGKNYRHVIEKTTNEPGYAGDWWRLSVINPAGEELPIYTRKVKAAYPMLDNTVRPGGSLNRYSCDNTNPVSWTISNVRFNSDFYMLASDGTLKSPQGYANCKGFMSADYTPGLSDGVVARHTMGVSVSERDISPPEITSLNVTGDGRVALTANDAGAVSYVHAFIESSTGGKFEGSPYEGDESTDTGWGKTRNVVYRFWDAAPGKYRLTVTVSDNNLNEQTITRDITIP